MFREPARDLGHLDSVQTSAPGQLCNKAMAVTTGQAPAHQSQLHPQPPNPTFSLTPLP